MKQPLKTLLLAAAPVLAAGPAFAQSTTWGARAATIAQDALNWGAVITILCYVLAGVFGIAFVVALFGIGKRNGNSSPGVAICALLAGALLAACWAAPSIDTAYGLGYGVPWLWALLGGAASVTWVRMELRRERREWKGRAGGGASARGEGEGEGRRGGCEEGG